MDDPLAPLLDPVSALRGVGPATAEKLARLTGGGRVRDLLFHLPDSFIDRRTLASLRDTVAGQVVTWSVEVAGHEPPASRPTRTASASRTAPPSPSSRSGTSTGWPP